MVLRLLKVCENWGPLPTSRERGKPPTHKPLLSRVSVNRSFEKKVETVEVEQNETNLLVQIKKGERQMSLRV
jgi:hypothetical protein